MIPTIGFNAMNSHEIVDLIETELAKHDIYPVNLNKAWPTSLYYGRFRSDLLQIRVSDHEKPYPPRKVEITILVRDGMSREEVFAAVHGAIQRFSEEENQIAREEGIL